MSAGNRFIRALNRVYDAVRHPHAASAATSEGQARGFDEFRGHRHCLLVTFRRNGESVPTPMWFGLADGNIYIRTGRDVAKARRIRNDPHVRVAVCTGRGRPLGMPIEATARVLPDAEADVAEAALRKNYGWGRRIYKQTAGGIGDFAYIEIEPVADRAAAGQAVA